MKTTVNFRKANQTVSAPIVTIEYLQRMISITPEATNHKLGDVKEDGVIYDVFEVVVSPEIADKDEDGSYYFAVAN
jgi:hypothetical protein